MVSNHVDSLDMLGAALGLAEQVERAAASSWAVDGLPSGDGVKAVLVAGMGGSGIGGDAAAALLVGSSPVPIVVSKHYECPGFVGPDTLVFANSFSGNTEETLSTVSRAAERNARIVVVASGGQLVDLAERVGAPVVPVDPAIPMPRAGIGAVTVPLLVVLERLGLASGVEDAVEAAVRQLRRRRDELAPGVDDSASRLARRIGRTIPLVYGGGPLGEVAAWRWKGQFNENCKVPSWCNRIPELTHNELCGWAQHGDVTRQVFTLLFLRHDHEPGNVDRRFEFVAESCDEVVAGIETVTAEGDSAMAQLFDLVLQGDLVSLRMAFNEGVDPGPIDILDQLKSSLSRRSRG